MGPDPARGCRGATGPGRLPLGRAGREQRGFRERAGRGARRALLLGLLGEGGMNENEAQGIGPLATALAKAQSEFGAVTRSKVVTVKTKTGGSFTFSYAPLDAIIGVIREPLARNGLAFTQLLDDGYLVTMLIHESGASLSGRTALPDTPDIQAYGSAITYLPPYALQTPFCIS